MTGLKNLIAVEINEAGSENYVISIYRPNYVESAKGEGWGFFYLQQIAMFCHQNTSDEFKLKFPELSQAEPSWNRAGSNYI